MRYRQARDMSVAMLGEVRKGLLISWTYRVNTLMAMFTLGFVFLGISFLMGGGELNPQRMASALIGYLAWFYALLAIDSLIFGMREEAQAGTLEQISMSPAPIGLVLLGRALANVILSTGQVLILGGAMFLLAGVRIPMRWEGLPVLAVTLVGVFGFGFVIAGAILVFKQIHSFTNLLQNILLFLNGTMLPVDTMPGWMAGIARTLPTTQGVVVLRKVILDGHSLTSTWRDGSLMWLVMHSAVYFAAGWAAFSLCERIAKDQGSLGQY
jgi:ABC-2 type transport system permease protein